MTLVADTPALTGPTALTRLHAVAPALVDGPPLPRRAFVAQIMGLPFSVHVRGPLAQSDVVAAAVAATFDRLRADDREFSPYRSDSAVSRIRRGELRLQDAGPRMAQVAALCHDAHARTDGAFSAWLPTAGGTVFDPTGLVKGWATQDATHHLVDALDALDAHRSHDVLVAAGGDVVVSCRRTDTPDWVIAVEDPHDRTRLLTSVAMRTGAVATSGTAARGQHVVDPRTGAPATALASATVVGPELLWADVYATAVLVDGAQAPWFARLRDHASLVVPR